MPIPQVRVIVNTGEGRAFQTGLDVVQLAKDPAALREQSRRTKRAELRLTAWHNGVSKPVIAAVNGVCAGGGLHFIADADIVIAAEQRQLPRPARLGGAGHAPTRRSAWHARSPFESVMRMALLGSHERISAQRAYDIGMVSQVVAPEELRADALEGLAEIIAEGDPQVLRARKRALWGALELGLTDSYVAAMNGDAKINE